MKRKHRMLAGLLWTALQCGLVAQASFSAGVPPCRKLQVYFFADDTDSLPTQKTGKEAGGPPARFSFEEMAGDRRRIYSVITWNYRIFLQLNGVYATENRIFLKVLLLNRSGTDYKVDTFRFFIRNNLYETGEEKLAPVSSYGMVKTIKTQGKALYIFALPKFTLSGKEHLDIELLEKQGGRHLRLRMGKRPLLHARLP